MKKPNRYKSSFLPGIFTLVSMLRLVAVMPLAILYSETSQANPYYFHYGHEREHANGSSQDTSRTIVARGTRESSASGDEHQRRSTGYSGESNDAWSNAPTTQRPGDYLHSSRNFPNSFSPKAQLEDPIVHQVVAGVLQQTNDPVRIVQSLSRYFLQNFTYDQGRAVRVFHPSGGDRRGVWGSSWITLRSHTGDCLGAAHTMAALLRAAGIPTIIAYTPGKYYLPGESGNGGYGVVSHYYNYVYIDGKWNFLEPQGPFQPGQHRPRMDPYMYSRFERD